MVDKRHTKNTYRWRSRFWLRLELSKFFTAQSSRTWSMVMESGRVGMAWWFLGIPPLKPSKSNKSKTPSGLPRMTIQQVTSNHSPKSTSRTKQITPQESGTKENRLHKNFNNNRSNRNETFNNWQLSKGPQAHNPKRAKLAPHFQYDTQPMLLWKKQTFAHHQREEKQTWRRVREAQVSVGIEQEGASVSNLNLPYINPIPQVYANCPATNAIPHHLGWPMPKRWKY